MSGMGHAHARMVVLEFLRQRVPGYLALIRQRDDVDSPVDPKPESYLLADMLPEDASSYPCVIVRSTTSVAGTRYESQTAGQSIEREFEYAIEVIVAAARREFSKTKTNDAPSVQSSLDRDRLALAVRLALMSPDDLGEGAQVSGGMREETGAASQLLDGKPIAAGTLAFNVIVIEELPVLSPAEPIAGHELSVSNLSE